MGTSNNCRGRTLSIEVLGSNVNALLEARRLHTQFLDPSFPDTLLDGTMDLQSYLVRRSLTERIAHDEGKCVYRFGIQQENELQGCKCEYFVRDKRSDF